jgi:hypothetical protein
MKRADHHIHGEQLGLVAKKKPDPERRKPLRDAPD